MSCGFDNSLAEDKKESLSCIFLQLSNKKQYEGIVLLHLEVYKLNIFSEELDPAGIILQGAWLAQGFSSFSMLTI